MAALGPYDVKLFQYDYASVLRIRNTFYDLPDDSPMIKRSSSDPALLSCTSSFTCETSASCIVTSVASSDLADEINSFSMTPSQSAPNDLSEVEEDADGVVPAFDQEADDGCTTKDGGDSSLTTVLVQGLPCKIGTERMMAELKHLGFDGCYSFINFPTKMKREKVCFLGYGFINFVSEIDAENFMKVFAGYRFEDVASDKCAHVTLAHVQGKPANTKRLRSSKKQKAFLQDSRGLRAPVPGNGGKSDGH